MSSKDDSIIARDSLPEVFDPSHHWQLVVRGLSDLKRVTIPMWPTAGYDSRNSGCCPYDTSHNKGRVKWVSETIGSGISCVRVGAGGTVYVVLGPHLYAVSPSGALEWKRDAGGDNAWYCPTIAVNGMLYVPADDGLSALDADGTLRFKLDQVFAAAIAVANDTLYVNDCGRSVLALFTDGRVKWQYRTRDQLSIDMVVDPDGRSYFGCKSGVCALGPDGILEWHFPTDGEVCPSVRGVAPDGTIHVYSEGTFYVLDRRGRLVWRRSVPDHLHGASTWSDPALGYWIDSLEHNSRSETVYLRFENGLQCIGADGAIRWTYHAKDDAVASADVSTDGTIYLLLRSGRLYALHPNGTGAWSCETGASGSWLEVAAEGEFCMVHSQRFLAVYHADGTVAWERKTRGDPIRCFCGTSVGGMVVATRDGDVRSHGPDGKREWHFRVGGCPIKSSPVIDSAGVVCVGSDYGILHAFYPDGKLKWTYDVGGEMMGPPVIGADNVSYSASDTAVFAIRPDGTLKWRHEVTDAGPYSSPIVSSGLILYLKHGYELSVYESKTLCAFDLEGSALWTYTMEGESDAYVAASESTVYVVCRATIHALHLDGTLQWRRTRSWEKMTAPPAVAPDGTICIVTDSALHVLNSDGTLRWEHSGIPGTITASPAIAPDGTIYALSSAAICEFAPDGTSRGWKFTSGSQPIEAAPVVAGDGTVYFGHGGVLHAQRLGGQHLWHLRLDNSVISGIAIAADGTIYATTMNGRLYCIH
jgi:outer membrane protein assembly factor BamB